MCQRCSAVLPRWHRQGESLATTSALFGGFHGGWNNHKIQAIAQAIASMITALHPGMSNVQVEQTHWSRCGCGHQKKPEIITKIVHARNLAAKRMQKLSEKKREHYMIYIYIYWYFFFRMCESNRGVFFLTRLPTCFAPRDNVALVQVSSLLCTLYCISNENFIEPMPIKCSPSTKDLQVCMDSACCLIARLSGARAEDWFLAEIAGIRERQILRFLQRQEILRISSNSVYTYT